MSDTIVDMIEDPSVVELQEELTPEQRTRWKSSMEQDFREIAEGKVQGYLSLEQFGKELRAAIRRRL